MVRPGDRLLSGAADRHRLDAAREAGVQVRFDDAHGDHEVGPRHGVVHGDGAAGGRRAERHARLSDPLSVDDAHPGGDRFALGLDGPALVLDAADTDPQFGVIFPADNQV